MKSNSSDNGFDELMRLSQRFTKQQKEHEDRERQREEQGKKVRGVLQGLRELNVSMALEQLKPIATPAIIKEVNNLKSQQGTEALRKAISDLADDLENRVVDISASHKAAAPLVNSMRTLNILMNLYFSLK